MAREIGSVRSSGMTELLLDKLHHATENFCVEQERLVEKLRAEVEALFVQQRQNSEVHTAFEEEFTWSESLVDVGKTRYDDAVSSQPLSSCISDSVNREFLVMDDEDSFDPDAIDLCASESSSSSELGMTTPCLAHRGSQKRNIQNNFASDWDAFVNKRRLHWDSLRRVIHHQSFVMMTSLIIMINTAYIGLVVQHNVKAIMQRYGALEEKVKFDVETSEWDVDLDILFLVIFTMEIVLRVLAEELVFFFGGDWKWNWMDLFLVGGLDVAFVVAGDDASQVRTVRLLRVFRMFHGLHLLINFPVFTKFRLLALAMQHSVVALTWACILLVGLLYLASIFFLNGISEYLMSGASDPEVVGTLSSYFGGLEWTMLTLFMCISGGVSWEVVVGALMRVNVAYGLFFCFVHCRHDAGFSEYHRGRLRERRH